MLTDRSSDQPARGEAESVTLDPSGRYSDCSLTPIAGEEAVGEMLSNFAARETDEPVTKDYLDARLAEATNRLLMWLMATIISTAGVTVAVVVAVTVQLSG